MCPAVGMCTCVAPGMAAAMSREWDGGVRRSAPPLMMIVLGANRGERGVLVVGPQAWQEPDGGGEGCRGHGRIEQRRKCGARVVADLEGHGGAHGLGKQANSPLRCASRELAQHVRSGTGQESGHAVLSEPTRRSGDEDDSVRLHGSISRRPAKVGEGDHPAHRVAHEGERAGHVERCQDVGEVGGELLDDVGACRGRIRPAVAAVVIADDPDSIAPPPGQVTDLASPRSLLKAETVQEHDGGLGVDGPSVSHRQPHAVADSHCPVGAGRGSCSHDGNSR